MFLLYHFILLENVLNKIKIEYRTNLNSLWNAEIEWSKLFLTNTRFKTILISQKRHSKNYKEFRCIDSIYFNGLWWQLKEILPLKFFRKSF